ncbi:MAG: hypothetical protein GXP16_18620 [Gammaproteobacteria bacterium]|nr:hypothetical protein [Gammaproteobacteria bacterium]
MQVYSLPNTRFLQFRILLVLAVGFVYLGAMTLALAQSPLQNTLLEPHLEKEPADSQVIEWVVEVSPYERIYTTGTIDLVLRQSDVLFVQAQGLPHDLGNLRIEVVDGVLYIDSQIGGVRPSLLRVELDVKQLKEVVTFGPVRVIGHGLQTPRLTLEGKGAGSFALTALDVNELTVIGSGETYFSLSGVVQHQVVDLSGIGRYKASALASKTSQVNVRGNGWVDLQVAELLDVNILGAAQVNYRGAPWVLQQILGSGVVQRLF